MHHVHPQLVMKLMMALMTILVPKCQNTSTGAMCSKSLKVSSLNAKQHFDGIQHLVPLIRIIVKKFHHIFLGGFRLFQICERCHDLSRLGSRNLKRICQNLRLSVPMNHQTTSRKNRMCHHLTPDVTIFSTTFPHTKVPPRCA